MLKKIALASLWLVATSGSAEAVADVECLGAAKKPQLIYMHGIDPPQMSDQEKGNRKILSELGSELGFGVAAVRAKKKCSGRFAGKLCWPFASLEELQAESKRLVAAVEKQCGGPILGWLGFSNGGYFTAKLVQYCVATPGWKIAVGSAGSWTAGDKSDLSKCGALTLLIGSRDLSRAKAHRFEDHLRSRKAKVELKEFTGGHELKKDVLKRVLQPRL